MDVSMDILPEKVIKSLCPNNTCSETVDYIYIGLENIEPDLVYWQASCQHCKCDKSGFTRVGFQNI